MSRTFKDTDAPHVVLLLHGIRTQASWAEMVSSVLETDSSILVQPVKYGFFDTLRFISPFFTRRFPVQKVIREYRDIRTKYPNSKISIIAHSFGTYIFSKLLNEPDIEFHRVILCGSIIPESFRLASYRAQIEHTPILNDCGTHDIWPVVAKSVTWGYGASGTFGFGTTGVRDRFNKFSHSEYFSRDYVKRFWVPYIKAGEVISTKWEEDRNAPPYWQSLLAVIPIRWFLLAFPLLAFVWAYKHFEASKIATVQSISPITIGHAIGVPVVGADLNIINNKETRIVLSGVRAKLKYENGKNFNLSFTNLKADGAFAFYNPSQMFPPLQSMYVESGQTQKFGFLFSGNIQKQQQTYFRIVKYLEENQINPPNLDLRNHLIPEKYVRELNTHVSRDFPWLTGSWTLEISFLLDGNSRKLTNSFHVTGGDIQRIKSSIPYYSTGMGVLPNWMYLSPDAQLSMSEVAIK